MEILNVQHLSKTYGSGETKVEALRNVSFSLEKATGFGAGQLCGLPDWSMYTGGMSAGHCMTSGRYCGIAAATGKYNP